MQNDGRDHDAAGKRFALIGVGGYIARATWRRSRDGGDLRAAFDRTTRVGIRSHDFPNARSSSPSSSALPSTRAPRRTGGRSTTSPSARRTICTSSHAVSLCGPAPTRSARSRWCSIPWDIDGLRRGASETGRKVNTILQLRLHPATSSCARTEPHSAQDRIDVDLTYVTSAAAGTTCPGRATSRSRAASPPTSAYTSSTC